MRAGWVAFVAGIALGSAAVARAPETSPFPRPRPDVAAVATVSIAEAAVDEARQAALSPGPDAPGLEAPAPVAPMSIAEAAVVEALRTPPPPPRPAGPAPVSIADAAVIEALRTPPPPPRPAPTLELASPAPAPVLSSPAVAAPVATLREAPGVSPQPRRRPSGLRPPVAIARVEAPARPPLAAAARDEGGLCGVRGLSGQRLPRITSTNQGCGIDEPVRITAVQGIALSPAATVNCDTARAFDRWVREAMVPAIGNRGGGVRQIAIGSHYACRGRNNQRGARLSEHARGNAIDVMGFQLADGESVMVESDFRRGRHRRAMQRMYEDACGIFRTTLGPGSDRFHENHFHFDLARHRNGGTYCR